MKKQKKTTPIYALMRAWKGGEIDFPSFPHNDFTTISNNLELLQHAMRQLNNDNLYVSFRYAICKVKEVS